MYTIKAIHILGIMDPGTSLVINHASSLPHTQRSILRVHCAGTRDGEHPNRRTGIIVADPPLDFVSDAREAAPFTLYMAQVQPGMADQDFLCFVSFRVDLPTYAMVRWCRSIG